MQPLVNYTPEITKQILKMYTEDKVPAIEIALQYGFPVKSVITKLSCLGVYKKKEYRNKDGTKPIKKADYVDQIAVLLGIPTESAESLEKVNKGILKLLVSKLSK